MSLFQLGVIEGFYGPPWPWEQRLGYAKFLAEAGLSFYIYAPKADPLFRKQWQAPIPESHFAQLKRLIEHYQAAGVEFGIGLTPYDLHFSFRAGKEALASRVETLNRLGVDRIALLFDDMKGALENLAEIQIDITHWVRDKALARQILMCPTYYSSDPLLDRLFGPRPPKYLETLGARLDPSIEIIWTGERVCSPGYPPETLREVTSALARKPFLWDNYPVNDGPKMCPFLHLRPPGGREVTDLAGGLAINPMNQPELSKIPILALARSLSGDKSPTLFADCAASILGPELSLRLHQDLARSQDQGLDVMDLSEKRRLAASYAAHGGPAAREICDWLEDRYRVTREVFLTQ